MSARSIVLCFGKLGFFSRGGCKIGYQASYFNFSLKQWCTLLAMTTVLAIMLVDSVSVPVILPTLQAYFGMGETRLGWVVNGHYLGIAAFILIGGRIADIRCCKEVFVYGLIAYIVTSLMTAFAPTSLFILICRAFQGISMAFVFPTATAVLIHTFNEKQRGRAWGVSVAASTLVMFFGTLFAGWAVCNFTWRIIFLFNAAIALLGIILGCFSLDKRHLSKMMKLDFRGAFYLAVALFSGIILAMQARSWGMRSMASLSFIFIGMVCLILLIFRPRTKHAHIIDFSIFENKQFFLCFSVIFVAQLLMPMPIYWIKYLQEGLGYSPLVIGKVFGYALLPTFFVALFAGYLSDRYHPRIPAFLGFFSILLSVHLFVLFMHGFEMWALYFAFMLFFSGNAFILTPASSTTYSHPAPESRGAAAGIYNMLRFLSYALGLSIFNFIQTYISQTKITSLSGLQKMITYDHRGVILLASIGALLTLVHLKSYNEEIA